MCMSSVKCKPLQIAKFINNCYNPLMQLESLSILPRTPMWEQYKNIKKNALDSLLLYRMGDFYELFLEDAKIAAAILDIALTMRHKNNANPIPMCGVPFHSATNYINTLLKHGKRVAICEQVEKVSTGKSIVKREIVRVVSPGMVYDHNALEAHKNNYLFSIKFSPKKRKGEDPHEGSYCALDVSTGESVYGYFDNLDSILNEISILDPKEFILSEKWKESTGWKKLWEKIKDTKNTPCVDYIPEYYFSDKDAYEGIQHHFGVIDLGAFELEEKEEVLGAIWAVFRRTKDNQKEGNLCHLQAPKRQIKSSYLELDESTIRHLDLFPDPSKNAKESLFFHLNQCKTAFGSRLLYQFLSRPLRDKSSIEERQYAIQALIESGTTLDKIREHLKGMHDLGRITSKLGLHSANPRDIVALKNTLEKIPYVKDQLKSLSKVPFMKRLSENIDPCLDLTESLALKIKEEPPPHTREGNIFKKNWHKELDELLLLSFNGSQTITDMEEKERAVSGITNLKIKYNRVFGYFIEISKSNLNLVPKHYTRKQTTANGERYITEELKILEHKLLSAREKQISLEAKLYGELLEELSSQSKRLLRITNQLALLDVLACLANIAKERNYTCPNITNSLDLHIEEGRHPVIEELIGTHSFVANTVSFKKDSIIQIITGPNMAGKSTFMRQTALLTLMAHMGSFIPAKAATIGIVDRVASRVGASDRIGKGQSTFMVEMSEIARILRQATPKSLLIIDEIGRGTSTFDGLAIAWAILEDIQSRLQARTLFATHYHELTELGDIFSNVCNISIAVEKRKGKVVFLHKVIPTKADGSYGVEVAHLAGLHTHILRRAEEILRALEQEKTPHTRNLLEKMPKKKEKDTDSIEKFPLFAHENIDPPSYLKKIEEELKDVDIDKQTPIDALLKLKSLREKLPEIGSHKD